MNKDTNYRASESGAGTTRGATAACEKIVRSVQGHHRTTTMQNLSPPVGCSRMELDSKKSVQTSNAGRQRDRTKVALSKEAKQPGGESATPPSKKMNGTCQPQQFGFPVNGFHPQWAVPGNTTETMVLASEASKLLGGMEAQFFASSSSFVEHRLNAKIDELIGRVRHEEAQKYLKRKEELDACEEESRPPSHRPVKRQRRILFERSRNEENTTTAHAAQGDASPEDYSSSSDFSDVYSDVFVNSNVAQVIATPGGRVVAWNDKFLEDTGFLPNQVCSSLTVFNLVQAKMLPKLFDLFSLALRGGSPSPLILESPLRAACLGGGGFQGLQQAAPESSRNKSPSLVSDLDVPPAAESGSGESLLGDSPVDSDTDDDVNSSDSASSDTEEDDSDTTHASITLPCVRFVPDRVSLLVTITLMNDVDPEKRCFHCVFAPDPNSYDEENDNDDDGREAAPGSHIHVNTREVIGEIRRISHKSFANLL